uniref:Putative RNA pseudouridine synthase n=1 Tax=Magnetococcus massalia (strain MO-1) TaxID=451514 RepID=A0A1S7LJM4_MAGMO|nr:putative RNA pseudouridine synthase [Candidatus Magnetococcus massalia]
MNLEKRLIYRDGLILILDKPAGVAVHVGPGGGSNLEAHFDSLRFGLPKPPALAHRLDRDTSGCLVLGRHRKALSRMGRLFDQRKVEKRYWAVVQGIPDPLQGKLAYPLHKISNKKSGWRMVVDAAQGKPSLTQFRTLGRGELNGQPIAWVECRPKTGRTHQLRVHLAELGTPILGDPLYGEPGARSEHNLMLHARSIRIPLYASKPDVEVAAEPPAPMQAMLSLCGYNPDDWPSTPVVEPRPAKA